MNGIAHYREAERLLDIAATTYEQAAGQDREVDDAELRWMQTSIEQAKVHATLALTATNLVTSRAEFTAWREVAQ